MSPPHLTGASIRVDGNAVARSMEHYRSQFGAWDRRASVRVKPRRVLGEAAAGQLYFPPELFPAAEHPLVRAQAEDAVTRSLVQRLYQYLYFTTELELVAVMPIAIDVSRGRSGLQLPPGMRADAFRITTDEAWHAQFSDDLLGQVAAETGINPVMPVIPRFIERLDNMRQRLEPGLRGAQELLFSIVSETLISSLLADIPKDSRMPNAVRELVGDHAEDEGKHHAYFRRLLEYFWPALSTDEKRVLGPLIPDLIYAFLEPDLRAFSYTLFDIGLNADQVEQVLAESFPTPQVQGGIASAARSTVRYFLDVGALDDPATRDAFADAGLR